VHLVGAYERRRGEDALFFGAALGLSGLEAAGGVSSAGGSAADGIVQLTVRAQPEERMTFAGTREVEIGLAGDLVPRGELFDAPPTIPTAVLELQAIADDPEVATLRLHIGSLDVGLGQIDEIRAAIKRVRAAGKKVIATISTADDKSYLVAAACETIRMDPAAVLQIDGFALTALYFAEGLGKLGVRFDAIEIGTHKSGPDPLTRNEPRPEDEATRKELLDRAYDTLVAALVEERRMTREEAERIVERGGFSASEAVTARLVDELTSPADPREVPVLSPRGERWGGLERPSRRWGELPAVAIVPVVGTIAVRDSDNPLPGDTAAAEEIVPQLEAVREDPSVVGVVLRVDSPGGELLASDLIWRAVRRVAEVKPLVVSMGDVAASGGYYVAAPAHLIFAEPNTLTGSIGIFFLKADLTGLYQWAGVHPRVYERGKFSDWDGTTHALTPEARERLTEMLRTHYETFLGKVAVGRHLELDAVRPLAEGRVYTGARAIEIGLVDRIGSLADAVAEVKHRAGLEPDAEIALRLPREPVTLLGLVGDAVGLRATSLVDAAAEAVRRVERWDEAVLALMPIHYDVDR
jgi:protease IV